MRALFWKDCRVNLFVLLFGLVMLLLPYLAVLTSDIYRLARYGSRHSVTLSAASNGAASTTDIEVGCDPELGFPETWMRLAVISLGLSLLTIAMLGGNAVAGERMDRSAEFLAYLPPTRRLVLASKATLAIGTSAVIWLLNVAVIYSAAWLITRGGASFRFADDNSPTDVIVVMASIAVAVLGGAWLISAVQASPAIATGVGIFAPVLVAGILQALIFYGFVHIDFAPWFEAVCVVMGILCFGTGTVYYLRRVEP